MDIRVAFRQLLKNPGFSLVAILTLALGIGANTAIFSVVDAILIRPLPYHDAGRLVMVWEDASRISFPRNTPSPGNWADWRAQNSVFTDIAASRGLSYNISGFGQPEQVPARRVTASFWTVLGAQPFVGRVFTEAEDRGSASVAVISYGLWQRRFAGDPHIAGRKVILNDAPFTIVGVMPREFYFLPTRLVDVWTPASFTNQDMEKRDSHYLNCIARLKPGVTLQQAQAEMRIVGERVEKAHPGHQAGLVAVVPLREQLAGNTRIALVILLCGAGCVLLIACANLANLLLARGAARQREVAIRAALGAGRGRLMRQFLTESLVLASLGAMAGLVLARLAMRFLETLTPETMIVAHLGLDWRVLGYAALIAIAAGLICGMVPAFGASRAALHDTLKQGGRGGAGARSHWLRDSLIVCETALAVALLVGAGLMLQTLAHLRHVDLGMRTEKLLTMNTLLSRSKDHAKRELFINAVLDKVRAIPGVTSAAYTSVLPLTETGNTSGYLLQGQSMQDAMNQDALYRVVTRDYFQTLGASLREGRLFTAEDRAGGEPVIVVNETFAARQFPGRSAIGARLQMGSWGPNFYWYRIVGVVKEVRERGISADLKPAVYLSHSQSDQAWPVPLGLMVRSAIDPAPLASAVRQAIWSIDRDQPVARVRTMEDIIGAELDAPRQDSALLGSFAGLALLLACVGLYGVLSYAVTQRTTEIGVRMALGATPPAILSMVAKRGLALTAGGLAIGLALSLAAGKLMSKLLYGIQPNDPRTMFAVGAVLLAVALCACVIPARRAARIDPMVALREE